MCDSLPSQSLSFCLHLVWSRSRHFPFSARKTRSPDWNPLWSDIMLTQCEGTHVHLEVIQTFTTYYSLIGFAGLNQWVQFVLGTRVPVSGPLAWLLWTGCVLLFGWGDSGHEKGLSVVSMCLQTLSQVLSGSSPRAFPFSDTSTSCHLVSSQKHVHCSTISEYIGHEEWHISPLT